MELTQGLHRGAPSRAPASLSGCLLGDPASSDSEPKDWEPLATLETPALPLSLPQAARRSLGSERELAVFICLFCSSQPAPGGAAETAAGTGEWGGGLASLL